MNTGEGGMDVILIQPQRRLSRGPGCRGSLPLALLTVATPLDVAGYEVRIIDQREEPDWERSLLAELKTKPICVGVTAMTGPQLWWALKASEVVKRNSDVPVVWGGGTSQLAAAADFGEPLCGYRGAGRRRGNLFRAGQSIG
ncbi:cobalamin-dependent protein [Chloroflexota bacterium]